MSLSYNNINISVNGSYILADSLSLTENGEQKPLYTLNNSRPYDNSPQGIKNNLSISYFLEATNEPNSTIIENWKSQNGTGNLFALLNIAGVITSGYLNNFSFSILPNQAIKANAGYLIFNEFTNFSSQLSSFALNYNNTGITLSHYWSAKLQSGNTELLDTNIMQLSYDWSSDIQPIYSLNSKNTPCQVNCLSATETIDILSEIQNTIKYSGNYFPTLYNGIDGLRLKPISSEWNSSNDNIFIALSGFITNNRKTDMKTEELIIFNNQFNKYY